MALDVGERTIGIALSDPSGRIALPHSTIRRTSIASDLESLQTTILEQQVCEIVVGMPRSLSGELHYQAEKTAGFIHVLEAAVKLPIATWDERFSTAEADRALRAGGVKRQRRSEVIDQTAAAVILQGYLAFRSNRG